MSWAPGPTTTNKQVHIRRTVWKSRSGRQIQGFRRQQAEQTEKRGSRLQQEYPVLENNLQRKIPLPPHHLGGRS